MDFEVDHTFPADPHRVADVLLDEDYQASLKDVGALAGREVLSQEAHPGGMVLRRTRCVLDIKMEGPARRFIGDSEPAWIEEATWHPSALRWDWVIHPEVAGELLEASGAIDLHPHDDGTLRRVHGRVRVKVPLYGGKVEGWIVDGLRRAYDEEADRLLGWLTGGVTPT